MVEKSEIEKLTRRFGQFEQARYEYASLSPTFEQWVIKLMRRRGEVILVVPRGGGRVLLHTKPHYPDNVYRLPTGGIQPKEAAPNAALRETFEEIGFEPDTLELLGLLENVFTVRERQFVYPSYVFRTEIYTRAPKPTDPQELISGFRDVEAAELRGVALHLSSLPAQWHEWGKFRGAPHAWLAEHLTR